MAPQGSLTGRQILVVEDDYFIADDLDRGLKGAGAEVLGPFSRVEEARQSLRGQTPAAAVLDINVAGTMIYPLAQQLRDAGVPILFATGYDVHAIPKQFDAVPRLVKPIEIRQLLASLANVLSTP